MAVICFDYDGVIADTLALESVYYVGLYKKRGITLFETGEELRNACRGKKRKESLQKNLPGNKNRGKRRT